MASTLVFLSLFFSFFTPSHSDLLPGILPPVLPPGILPPGILPAPPPGNLPGTIPNIIIPVINPADICKSLLNSPLCDLVELSIIAVNQSLSTATSFSIALDSYISNNVSNPSFITSLALQDCQLLAGLNTDFLTNTNSTVNSTRNLPNSKIDDLHTLLSAVLTNQQTCYDGLQMTDSASSVLSDLSPLITNATLVYTITLDSFVKAWTPKKQNWTLKKGRNLLYRDGRMALRMSDNDRRLFESRSGRRLIDLSASQVSVRATVVVSQDGTGNFTTIGDAVNAAPDTGSTDDGSNIDYFMIYVDAGVYEEYVIIPKNKGFIMMIGAGINQTIITGNRSHGGNWTTFSSATLAVLGRGFVGINMTIRNTAGAINHQAVALRDGADLSAFYKCSFDGYQDTLYAHSLRQFYRECDIYGTIDYVFGNSAVLFQNCNFYSRLPMANQFNTVTAQGRTDLQQNTGISIQNSNFLATPDLALNENAAKTYLGRPWKIYSLTVIMESFIDSVIDPAGWVAWSGDFALATLYYAEYDNRGPGSNTSQRVTWPGYHVIGSAVAINFTLSNFISGDIWLPKTGIPYQIGLNSN